MSVLKLHIDGAVSTYLEAANLYQREMRHTGRPIRHQKLIGTTLLVKGLEYDHAVILDADSLDTKDLYVAMTRGAKSLTIICNGKNLPSV
jgi:DNA helicase-2/ATP-dependent DNA helicase PcrA